LICRKKSIANKIRSSLLDKKSEELKKATYIFLYERIKSRFTNFILERGIKTHYEDVALLSVSIKRIILIPEG
jgi:hypothetical protein